MFLFFFLFALAFCGESAFSSHMSAFHPNTPLHVLDHLSDYKLTTSAQSETYFDIEIPESSFENHRGYIGAIIADFEDGSSQTWISLKETPDSFTTSHLLSIHGETDMNILLKSTTVDESTKKMINNLITSTNIYVQLEGKVFHRHVVGHGTTIVNLGSPITVISASMNAEEPWMSIRIIHDKEAFWRKLSDQHKEIAKDLIIPEPLNSDLWTSKDHKEWNPPFRSLTQMIPAGVQTTRNILVGQFYFSNQNKIYLGTMKQQRDVMYTGAMNVRDEVLASTWGDYNYNFDHNNDNSDEFYGPYPTSDVFPSTCDYHVLNMLNAAAAGSKFSGNNVKTPYTLYYVFPSIGSAACKYGGYSPINDVTGWAIERVLPSYNHRKLMIPKLIGQNMGFDKSGNLATDYGDSSSIMGNAIQWHSFNMPKLDEGKFLLPSQLKINPATGCHKLAKQSSTRAQQKAINAPVGLRFGHGPFYYASYRVDDKYETTEGFSNEIHFHKGPISTTKRISRIICHSSIGVTCSAEGHYVTLLEQNNDYSILWVGSSPPPDSSRCKYLHDNSSIKIDSSTAVLAILILFLAITL